MCQKTIALVGILLSSLVLAGCMIKTVENRSDLNSTVCNGPEWKPIGKRKARVVLWGVTHNHAKGKFDALRKLKDDYEIVGIVSLQSYYFSVYVLFVLVKKMGVSSIFRQVFVHISS